MPMTLNTPVEIAFPAPPAARTYFMAVTGVGGKTLDVVVDGAGTAIVSSDGFVLPESGGTGEGGGFTTTRGRASTITMNPARDTLFLTVTSTSPAIEGHTRVSVNEATNVLALRARYLSPVAMSPARATAFAATLGAVSQVLYQTTMGHVRIGSLTLLSRLQSSDGSSAAADIDIVPPSGPGNLVPPANLPHAKVVFDMNTSPTAASTSPAGLAAALLNSKFGVPLEPPDADATVTCPNSLMANGGRGMIIPTLCWRGNHNPFGSNGLGLAAPASAWDTLAPALGITPPAASPVHVLRNISAVLFPIATTIVP
jgi:hypothetical protein